MKARRSVLLVVALVMVATSCGDGGPNLPTQSKGWLLQFKRVTLAADAPDRLEIEIVVRADISDEVHIHGYDYKADVTPDNPAVLTFVADLPGIYEVELEDSHTVLFEFVVR